MPLRIEQLAELLRRLGLGDHSELAATALLVLAVIVAAWITKVVARRILLRVIKSIAQRTRTSWDDRLVDHRFFDRVAHLAPAVVIQLLIPVVLAKDSTFASLAQRLVLVYMVVVTAAAVDAFLNAGVTILGELPATREKPVKSYAQVVKILVYIFAGVVAVAALVNRSPWVFLSGLGAVTAIVLLIFKDSILGFVASIQIAAYDLVRRGDWISMPKFGADGDVIDISLNTVKVQNWDKTISTIPAYALISESFKNWRGMADSGGRRIKRAVHLDLSTIKFLDAETLARFKKIQHIKEYLERKEEELAAWNKERGIDDSSLVNGRRLTNVGTFRAYVEAYLRTRPDVHPDLTFLVRQLEPGPTGLPIEIYLFLKEQRWAYYEGIQADIFDHILAVVPEFDLRVFQEPTGADFRRLKP